MFSVYIYVQYRNTLIANVTAIEINEPVPMA